MATTFRYIAIFLSLSIQKYKLFANYLQPAGDVNIITCIQQYAKSLAINSCQKLNKWYQKLCVPSLTAFEVQNIQIESEFLFQIILQAHCDHNICTFWPL